MNLNDNDAIPYKSHALIQKYFEEVKARKQYIEKLQEQGQFNIDIYPNSKELTKKSIRLFIDRNVDVLSKSEMLNILRVTPLVDEEWLEELK